MTHSLCAMLKSAYDIASQAIHPAPGGFSAKAYQVDGADGAVYFLKVYDKSLPTTRPFVERIASYMPALDYLAASRALRGRVLTPVRTLDGAYMAQTDTQAYVLFLFVQGEVPGIEGVTREQSVELAQTLALLHEAGREIPFPTPGLAEDVSLSFCERLERFIREVGQQYGALWDILTPHADALLRVIREALNLRDRRRLGYAPLVLCHGDAHGNNLIQGERLVLADWEDLRWAPPEADLFIHAWHPHGEVLLEAYEDARQDYRIDRELLRFYVLRRRLEDVWVDIERLTQETPDEDETAKLLEWVRQGVEQALAAARHTIFT